MIWIYLIYLISLILLYVIYVLYINTETYRYSRPNTPHKLKMWHCILYGLIYLIPILNIIVIAFIMLLFLLIIDDGTLIWIPPKEDTTLYKIKEFLNKEV